jgi:hypothetical protein
MAVQWAGVKLVVLWYEKKRNGEELLVWTWNMYIGPFIAISEF